MLFEDQDMGTMAALFSPTRNAEHEKERRAETRRAHNTLMIIALC